MATPQTSARRSARGNGHDRKTSAARAARDDLHTAQEAAETFVSAVRSSAGHLTEHLGRTVEEKVNRVQSGAEVVADKAKEARHSLEARVRENPMTAVGIAAGAGVLLAMLSRRGLNH